MPGFDRTGPMGAGSMTGGRRGLCNPAYTGIEAPFSERYAYGRGMGPAHGFRRGYSPGRGFRRGFCRGFPWYPPEHGPTYPMDQNNEINMLKSKVGYMKNTLDAINKRIAEMEK